MAHVLVIDDSPEVCGAMAKLLKVLGHRADCVSSGAAGLEYLRGDVPDLILLDVMMPGMDGPEVLRTVRGGGGGKGGPVVMYSALDDPDLRDDLLALGANDYWVKGAFDFDEVERRIG